jgi:hypothetical protein
MTRTRTERTEWPILPATAAGKGLGSLPIGSAQSRAAARALMTARKHSEAEEQWDKESDVTGLAEAICTARERAERGESLRDDWSPIYIPPGKENTVRGRLAVRINAARARMANFQDERTAGE